MSDVFAERLAAWQEYCATPWARIRYAVVEETLRREAKAIGGRLRVLDIGGGDARDALPLALAGHDVTVMDPAASWLAEAERRATEAGVTITTHEGGIDDLPESGDYDLVLCHFVLHYRAAGAGDIARLARLVRPGGRLSVMCPNPVAMVLSTLVRSGPEAALEQLKADSIRSVTFDHDARKVTADEVAAEMGAAGLDVVARYATRIANDLLTDNDAKADPVFFERLLELELALCDREPYVRIGGLWQLVASKR